MRKSAFSTFPIVVAGVCMAVLVFTAEAIKISHPKYNDAGSNVVAGRYIISFPLKDTKASSSFASSFKKNAKGANLKVKETISHDLFNAISVSLDTSDESIHASALETILNTTEVLAVYPLKRYKRPTAQVVDIGTNVQPTVLPHVQTQVAAVHDKLKNKGKGIFVGVLDTGIDYTHPALGGGFGKGHKVIAGYDLVGDAYTGFNTPVPDSDPLDACGADTGASGHGTHVSGIIAGYDAATNFTGVAPEANLGMWRVFGCTGQVTNDIVIKALLMAYDAGCDVINLSLGETNAWSQTIDAEAQVVNQISAKGVSVVIAAGNDGAEGIFTVGQPSTATSAFSVASIDNYFYTSKEFTASGIDHSILYTSSNEDTFENGPIAIGSKNVAGTSQGCSADDISSSVNGKIALIKRGTCAFTDKVNNLANAGAIGVVIYNNVAGSFTASTPGVTVPVISVTLKDGNELVAAIQAGTVDLKFNKAGSVNPIDTAGTVSSFSSTGASAELNFKPQIAGIGGQVYSTLPGYLDSWGVMSGTSMATPYVAGTVALYLASEGKKRKSISFVHEQFQNYAKIAPVYNTSTPDSPVRQGAGLVQIYDAITQKVHVTPAGISFNDTSSSKYKTHTITVTNYGDSTISYQVLNKVTVGVAPYDRAKQGYTPLEPAGNTVAAAKLRFSKKNFKLAPGKSQKITVTVTAPKTNPKDYVFYGGFIQLKSSQQNKNKDVTVPYIGVVGKLVELPIFDVDSGFPVIIDSDSNEYTSKDTFTYNRNATDSSPIAVLRFLTPTAHVKADLLNSKKKVVGQFFTGLDYIGRNFLAADSAYNTYVWDGTYVPTIAKDQSLSIPVTEGTYYWKFSALKLFGNAKSSKDWETWTSGPIVVKN